MEYTIRQFLPHEAQLYKSIRLEALKLDPGMFGNSHATEAAYEDKVWQDRLNSTTTACFGLFRNDELIGLTSIVRNAEKPEEAYMTQSYIRKAYRGKGLSRLLYEARISWAREHGIRHLTIGHRASNLASQAANQRFGFSYSHRLSRLWPDGAEEDMVYYSLDL
jgi:RimJ/RimL family protein N-acetyltransferase